MSPRIRVLPAHLANQIAAGEVVERPASVVKELVENAIDAGARAVRIEIEAGGVGRIRVTDDGSGMTAEEAVLALERHATSKISSVEDLSCIRTLGFRGEALPSIASVSKLFLRTRVAEALEGTELRVAGGGPPDVRAIGFPAGTQIDVTELFFNTPARLKFLRTISTEAGHAIEAAVRIALSHPAVAITVLRDGKTVREFLVQKERSGRVREAVPDEPLYGAEGTIDGITVQGWLGAPHRARAGAAGLYTFVNGRHVRDRGLLRGVAQSFGGTLEAGRYPLGVVFVDLAPHELDVNVHPQKSEVRFARHSTVVGVVTRVLEEALRAAPWARPAAAPAVALAQGSAARSWEMGRGGPRPGPSPTPPLFPPGATALDTTRGLFEAAPVADVPVPVRGGLYSALEPVGQVRGTYIVCEGPDGLAILDQHASHERVTFDRLRRQYRASDVAVQRLLFAERIELDAELVAVAEDRRDALAAIGMDVEPLGATSVALRSVPSLVARADPRRLLVDVLAEVGTAAAPAFSATVDLVLATMACHGSVRAGDRLEPEEIRALLAALDEVDFSGNCPHGRPILMTLSWSDLERRVGRR